MGFLCNRALPGIGILVAFLAVSAPLAEARDCQYEKGEARWDIKNSVPSAARETVRGDGTAQAKNVAGRDVTLREGDVVTVDAYLYRARCQQDGDYHLEIGSQLSRGSSCLIAEVPDPDEIKDAALRALVAQARTTSEGLDASVFASHPTKPPLSVRITGQLFLDAPHLRSGDPGGGRGTLLESGRHCASNLWEIHPIT